MQGARRGGGWVGKDEKGLQELRTGEEVGLEGGGGSGEGEGYVFWWQVGEYGFE